MLMYSVTQPIIKLEGLNALLEITASQVEKLDLEVVETKPIKVMETKVLDSDGELLDEWGVKYSAGGLKLIRSPRNLTRYVIKEGCLVICDGAFCICIRLTRITIPNSVTEIWAVRLKIATNDIRGVEEVQIDCDWPLKTESVYLKRLNYITERLHAKKISVSATIRLHQL